MGAPRPRDHGLYKPLPVKCSGPSIVFQRCQITLREGEAREKHRSLYNLALRKQMVAHAGQQKQTFSSLLFYTLVRKINISRMCVH